MCPPPVLSEDLYPVESELCEGNITVEDVTAGLVAVGELESDVAAFGTFTVVADDTGGVAVVLADNVQSCAA